MLKEGYASFGELVAKEQLDVDYKVEVDDKGANVSILAIHGGLIEVYTDTIAEKVAALGDYNYYGLKGIKEKDNFSLHISSSKYDDHICLEMVQKSKFAVSFHGAKGIDNLSYIGGRDIKLRDLIIIYLNEAGFRARLAPSHISGLNPNNITNLTQRKMGAQIETDKATRVTLLSNAGLFEAYCKAINRAIKERIRGTL